MAGVVAELTNNRNRSAAATASAVFALLGAVLALCSVTSALLASQPRAVDPAAAPLCEFNREHLVGNLANVLDDVVATEPRGRWRCANSRS